MPRWTEHDKRPRSATNGEERPGPKMLPNVSEGGLSMRGASPYLAPSSMPAPTENVPNHVAIIMDGNGRWATKRGLPRIEGHRRGVETVRTTTYAARDLGVRMLTLYAFSIENWKRPQEEVGALMGLLEFYLKKELDTFVRDRVCFRTIGRTEDLPVGVQKLLRTTTEETKHFADYTLVLALNYGARTEIVDAARAYAHVGRDAHQQFSPAAGRLRGVRFHARALAGFHESGSRGRHCGLQSARAAVWIDQRAVETGGGEVESSRTVVHPSCHSERSEESTLAHIRGIRARGFFPALSMT